MLYFFLRAFSEPPDDAVCLEDALMV